MDDLKEIESRQDVDLLVRSFYTKVRKDELIGPVFNSIIAEEEWENHFEKLTDFWETNLFAAISYKGNPMLKHAMVDAKQNGTIGQEHFGRWLMLWIETIDQFFRGERAEKAKYAARKMSTGLFVGIYKARQKP
ncbi:MAG: group III truncated hemoglobin [Bacteroidota bacterium]